MTKSKPLKEEKSYSGRIASSSSFSAPRSHSHCRMDWRRFHRVRNIWAHKHMNTEKKMVAKLSKM